MKLSQPQAEIYVPDGAAEDAALERVTSMGIAAHQDDVEIMCLDGILAGFGKADKWFMAVIVTNGAGSPRNGLYATYTDDDMRAVRRLEQKKAAFVGEYAAVAFLDHPSSVVKDPREHRVIEDIKAIVTAAQPEIVYTHNLADKHDTHVGVALRTVAALCELPAGQRPRRLLGCEVWRDLDWVVDADKVLLRADEHENIAAALVGVFDSQIAGGKRYDLATMGRRRANATYFQSHAVDTSQMVNFAMDLTPLIENPGLDPAEFIQGFVRRFAEDVAGRMAKFS